MHFLSTLIIIHDMPKEQATKYIKELREFYNLASFSGFQVMLIAPALCLENQPTEKTPGTDPTPPPVSGKNPAP